MRKVTKQLIKAARKGNVSLAARLIGSRHLSHLPEWLNGYKFLRITVQENNTAFAKFLLEMGSSTNRPPVRGRTAYGSPLQFAIVNNNLEIIKLLLSKGADVDSDRNRKGKTLLTFAVENRSSTIVNLLLDHGADVNLADECGLAPLHVACKNNLEIANLLIARGADGNAVAKNGYAPIHFAVGGYGDLSVGVLKLLLHHGAQVDLRDKHGDTALNLTVTSGRFEIIEILLQYHPDVNIESNQRCLEKALRDYFNDTSKMGIIVTALLDYGFTIKPEFAKNGNVFNGAIATGNVKIVEELIQYGADVNPVLQFNSNCIADMPLHVAVKYQHEQVVKLLISHKVDVDSKDIDIEHPIYFSVANADLKITQLLLNSGAHVKHVLDLLQIAVRVNSIEIIETLLVHGADINSRDSHGNTALHFTVFNGKEARFGYDSDDDDYYDDDDDYLYGRADIDVLPNLEVAQFLLNKGANVDAQSEYGLTALHGSVRKGFNSMVDLLLRHNADLNLVDKNGLGSLHIAAETGNKEIAAVLLKKGAKVNGTTKDGNTPLHFAAASDHKEMVEFLIENGAQVNFRGKLGRVPLHSASDPDIINTLWMSGADIDSTCDKGKTALLYSTVRGDLISVTALLEYGADINIACSRSQTVFDYAMLNTMLPIFNADMMPIRLPPSFMDVVDFVSRHYVKTDAADLTCTTSIPYEYASIFGGRESSQADLLFQCQLELDNMKSKYIGNGNVTYYDFLKKDTISLAKYMNNESMVQALDSEDLRGEFPLYAGMLKGQFRKGLARLRFLEAARRVLRRLVDLPEVCTEKILDELNDEDLRLLIEAGK